MENVVRRSRTNFDRVLDILAFHDITEKNTAFLSRFPVTHILVIVVKYNSRRVDNFDTSLQLDRLELFRMTRLGGHCAHLTWFMVSYHLCIFEKGFYLASLHAVDQATFADIGKSDYADRYASSFGLVSLQ